MALRVKIRRLVVAFRSTADAIAAEQSLSGLPRKSPECGRLIPVPRSVSAGCGMAWKDEIDLQEAIKVKLERDGIEPEQITEADFFEKQEYNK